MNKFLNYLNSKKIAHKKKSHFYVIWVSKFTKFLIDKPVDEIDNDDINRFINKLSKNYQEWRVNQAAEAIQVYLYYKKHENRNSLIQHGNTNNQRKIVANEMINMLRLIQRSRETEKSYMYWLRDFYRFLITLNS